MPKNLILTVITLLSFALPCPGQTAETQETPPARVVVYYCHSTFRCASCLALEGLTSEAVLGTVNAPGPLAAEVAVERVALEVVDLDAPENAGLVKRLDVEPKTVLLMEETVEGILRKSVFDRVWFLLD